jgi:hypothetical protein
VIETDIVAITYVGISLHGNCPGSAGSLAYIGCTGGVLTRAAAEGNIGGQGGGVSVDGSGVVVLVVLMVSVLLVTVLVQL